MVGDSNLSDGFEVIELVTEDDLNNHKSMDLSLALSNEVFDSFLEGLVSEFELDKQSKRSHRKKYEATFNVILSNLIYCEKVSNKIYLKVSLDNSYYSNLSREMNPYRLSAGLIAEIIDWLEERDYLDVWKGFRKVRKQRRTRIKAKELLVEKFRCLMLLSNPFSTRPPKIVLILRDKDKNKVTFRRSKKVQVMESSLRDLNSMLENTRIENDRNPLPPQYFYRVFNDNCFESGGRFYGAGVQNLSKEERSKLKINGNAVVEHDFSGLHINMLYAITGKKCGSNPYFIPGFDRELVKFAMLVLLNAPSKASASKAINKKKKKFKVTKEQVKDLLLKLEEVHADIREYFYNSKSKHLQFLDSQMAEIIINEFVGRGYPILPVHDSFIVEQCHSSLLRSIMLAAYRVVLNNDKLSIAIH